MRRPGIRGERMAVLFLFGMVAFNPPLLGVFNADALFLGIPVLFVYLFLTWGLLIVFTALTVGLRPPRVRRSLAPDARDAGAPGDGGTP